MKHRVTALCVFSLGQRVGFDNGIGRFYGTVAQINVVLFGSATDSAVAVDYRVDIANGRSYWLREEQMFASGPAE